MTHEETIAWLKSTTNVEMTVTLTGGEWTAVVGMLTMAVNAGCPIPEVPTAIEKIAAVTREQMKTEWPEEIM